MLTVAAADVPTYAQSKAVGVRLWSGVDALIARVDETTAAVGQPAGSVVSAEPFAVGALLAVGGVVMAHRHR